MNNSPTELKAVADAIGLSSTEKPIAEAFQNLAEASFVDRRLLFANSRYSSSHPTLGGTLGIKLLVWFLVHSIFKTADQASSAVMKPLRNALTDISKLIGTETGSWCQVRYPIRVVHFIHDAFEALMKENSTQKTKISQLSADNESLRQQIEEIQSRVAYEVAATVRSRSSPDKQKASDIIQLLIKNGLKRYSSADSRSRSKRQGPLVDCGPLFYVQKYIKPELEKFCLGYLSEDISIYKVVMPELYNPHIVIRYRKSKNDKMTSVAGGHGGASDFAFA